MVLMDTLACVVFLTVAMTYLNARYVRLPRSVALTSGALLLSLVVLLLSETHVLSIRAPLRALLSHWPYDYLVLKVLLGYLLYAGAIDLNVSLFKSFKGEILVLSVLSTLISTAVVALLSHQILHLLGISFSWLSACFFGALISPTDPIAVLATLKRLRAPESVATKMAGESLFNDGVGVVIFMTLLAVAEHGMEHVHAHFVIQLFCQQALGGLIYGACLGYLANHFMRSVQDLTLCTFLSLSVVTCGYPMAEHLGVSGPLAMVVAGMFASSMHRRDQLPRSIRQGMMQFWHVIDEALNALLFMLLGLELILVDLQWHELMMMLTMIPVVLLARCATVWLPISFFSHTRRHRSTIPVLVWGGLRGGLAVALALSVPHSADRHNILVMTYAVVLFSVLVQANTVGAVIRYFSEKEPSSSG